MPPKNAVLGNLVAFRVRLASQSPNQIDFYGGPPPTLGAHWGPWATQLNQTGEPECQKPWSQRLPRAKGHNKLTFAMGLKIFGAFYERPRNAMVRKGFLIRGDFTRSVFLQYKRKVSSFESAAFFGFGGLWEASW